MIERLPGGPAVSASSHLISSDCNSTAAVPSLTLRTALSPIPFVSDLCGVDVQWWADSMECYCCLRNIQDLLSFGKTPCARWFGIPFNGPVMPFGGMVDCHPISAKDQSRLHQFGPKVFPGRFLGYAFTRGGESGKETFQSQTLKIWNRWTHLKSTPEGSMQKKC